MIPWEELISIEGLDPLVKRSEQGPVVLFKHSVRCGLSAMVKDDLEASEGIPAIPWYHLDLIQHRAVSDEIAERFGVQHESPQLLLIEHGRCTGHWSHRAVGVEELNQALTAQHN